MLNAQFPNPCVLAPRPEIAAVPDVPHGGLAAHLPADALDFSSNVNPYGPSPRVWAAMRQVAIEHHPDPRAAPLRRLLAQREGLPPEALLVGNGSVDLLYQLAVAHLRPGDVVLAAEPTFGEYAAAAALMGARVERLPAAPEAGFAHDPEALADAVRRLGPRVLFVCNPNNPTGAALPAAALARLADSCPDTLLVLDEAFAGFLPEPWPGRALLGRPNLAILRSLTKDYALTGLRAGYLLGPPDLIGAVAKAQPPWSVNAMAQAAAAAALADEQYLRGTLAALAVARADLAADLARIGLAPLPTQVHFFLLEVGRAALWRQRLLDRGILVRDCTSFGLPGHIRISARRPEENARLLETIDDLRLTIDD